MFESRHQSTGGSSANRWLIVAGAGLVILAFVARMLLDIGHTRVSDLAGVLKPDTTAAQVPAPAVVTPEAVPDSATTVAPMAVVDTPNTPPPVPAPSVPAATTPAPAVAGSGYSVQIGAFGSEANANKLRDRATKLGYTAAVVPQPRGDGSTLYLVRVRGLTGVEARQASDSLARTLGVKSVVVPSGR